MVTCRVVGAPPPATPPGCLGVPAEGLSAGLRPWLSSAPARGVIPSCPHAREHGTQQRREAGRVHVSGFDKTLLCPHHVPVNVPAAAERSDCLQHLPWPRPQLQAWPRPVTLPTARDRRLPAGSAMTRRDSVLCLHAALRWRLLQVGKPQGVQRLFLSLSIQKKTGGCGHFLGIFLFLQGSILLRGFPSFLGPACHAGSNWVKVLKRQIWQGEVGSSSRQVSLLWLMG